MNYKINNAFSISGKMISNTHFRLYRAFLPYTLGTIQLQANVVYTVINYNMLVSGRETFIKCRFDDVT